MALVIFVISNATYFMHTAILSLAALAYFVAIQQDLFRRLIPNTVSALLVVLAIARWAETGDLRAAGWALLAAFLVFLVTLVLYARGLFGGGDVKLLVATVFFFGSDDCFSLLLTIGFAGGCIALVVLLWYAIKSWYGRHSLDKIGTDWGKVTVPYGIAIALPAIWLILTRPLPT